MKEYKDLEPMKYNVFKIMTVIALVVFIITMSVN